MQRAGQHSWLVRTEGREELNFAIYIGCTYDVLPPYEPFSNSKRWSSTGPLVSLSESDRVLVAGQWNQWWAQIVSGRAAGEHQAAFYSPHHFETLEAELGEVCRSTWSVFREWWQMPAGGQIAMAFWESAAPIQQYVVEFEAESGRKAKPFCLEVDYVYAGLDDVLEVSDEYVVMPLRSQRESKPWWMEKIRQIC